MSNLHHPIRSLQQSHWFKLICGASFQHLPTVRSLAIAYGLAGMDCVDVAADPAVVAAVREGLAVVRSQRQALGLDQPLLMVSLNDGEDPHFRKAAFDPQFCPKDCPRPCETICPAQAIAFPQFESKPVESKPGNGAFDGSLDKADTSSVGVIESRCYGCGRCLPVCPLGLITTRAYVSSPATVMAMMLEAGVDAVEIHTQVGRVEDFRRLWAAIAPNLDQLQLVAVSCGEGDVYRNEPGAYGDYLQQLYSVIQPHPRTLIWQTDGRPMSGDIGAGTTHATIQLAQKLMAMDTQRLPGFIQLAGGTNLYTVPKLQSMNLLKQQGGLISGALSSGPAKTGRRAIAGVAYGSFARSHLAPVLEQLESRHGHLEDHPDLLQQAVTLATELVAPLKRGFPWENSVAGGRSQLASSVAEDSKFAEQPFSDRFKNSLSALS